MLAVGGGQKKEQEPKAGGIWTDQGPGQDPEVQMPVDVLRDIAQHMQLDTRENTIFHKAFNELDSKDKEMNECWVNCLHFMNSVVEQDVRQSLFAMGIILKRIGARASPLGSPDASEEEEDSEENGENEEGETMWRTSVLRDVVW